MNVTQTDTATARVATPQRRDTFLRWWLPQFVLPFDPCRCLEDRIAPTCHVTHEPSAALGRLPNGTLVYSHEEKLYSLHTQAEMLPPINPHVDSRICKLLNLASGELLIVTERDLYFCSNERNGHMYRIVGSNRITRLIEMRGGLIAIVDDTNKVVTQNTLFPSLEPPTYQSPGQIMDLIELHDGSLALACEDGRLRIWHPDGTAREFFLEYGSLRFVRQLANGSLAIICKSHNRSLLHLYQSATTMPIQKENLHFDEVISAVLLLADDTLVLGTESGILHFWRAGEELISCKLHTRGIHLLYQSPEGHLYSADTGGTIHRLSAPFSLWRVVQRFFTWLNPSANSA